MVSLVRTDTCMKILLSIGTSIVLFVSFAACSLPEAALRSADRTCAVCGTRLFSRAESDFDADGLDSPSKVFHHYGIQWHPEAYLICVYQVEKTGGGKNEMKLNVTVVDCIKGTRKVGERFVFTRVLEGTPEEFAQRIPNFQGGLYYVFLTLWDNGQVGVDAQDPIAMWGYTDELREIVDRHKRQLSGAANGSQPNRSGTKRTSGAAGFRR